MASVNLSDLYQKTGGGSGAEVFPPDTYDLEVTSAKAKEDGTTIMPVFKIIAGPYAGKKVLAGGFFFTSEGAASIAFQNLAGFGLDKTFFTQATRSVSDIATALVGRQVRVILNQSEYKGTTRNGIEIGKIQLLGQAPPAGQPGVAALPVTVAAPVAPPVAAPVAVAAPVVVAPAVAVAPPVVAPAPVAAVPDVAGAAPFALPVVDEPGF